METDPADRGWTTVRIDTETHRLLLLYHARLQAAKDSNYLRYPAYLCGRFPLGHAVRFLLDQQCRRNARRRAARGLARPRPHVARDGSPARHPGGRRSVSAGNE